MDWFTPFYADVQAIVKAAWPDVTVIFGELQMEKRNWANEIEKGKIVPPWAVIHVPGFSRDSTWGADKVAYCVPIIAYWVGQDSGSGMLATVYGKMMDIQNYVLNNNVGHTVLPDGMMVDASAGNPINASMLAAAMPYSSGSFMFTLLGGFVS